MCVRFGEGLYAVPMRLLWGTDLKILAKGLPQGSRQLISCQHRRTDGTGECDEMGQNPANR